jgi:hypothetical protein
MMRSRTSRRRDDQRIRPNLLQLEDRLTPFAVTSLGPAAGSMVPLPLSAIEVNFDAPINPTTIAASDLVLSRGSVTGVSQLDDDTLLFTLIGPATDDIATLNVSIPAGRLTDTAGIPNAAFAGSYTVDVDSVPFPSPLSPRLPLGSLIHSATAAGRLGNSLDVDEYTLNLDPGQTLAVAVDQDGFPSANLQPTIEVIGPDGISLGQSTAAAIGAPANLLVEVETGGTYRVRVGSAAGAGFYTIQATLNGAIEGESFAGGPANNSLATAQDIDESFTELRVGPTTIQRGGAAGITDPGQQLIVNGSFEGSLFGWTTETTGFTYGDWTAATPQAGFFPLLPIEPQDGSWVALNAFDGFTPLEFRLSQVVAIPADAAAVSLSWKDRVQWDFTFGFGLAQARTYIVEVLNPATGELLATLHSFSTGPETTNPTGNTGWLSHSVDLSAFAGQSVRLMFREVVPEGLAGPGSFELDAVSLAVAVPDYYKLTLAAGERVSVAIDGQSSTGLPVDGVTVSVDLLDAAGNVIAAGVAGATNLDEVISNHAIAASGDYYLRVTSPTRLSYGLVVVRDAAFDTEGNDTFETAQPIGPKGALGAIAPGTEATPDVVPGDIANVEGQSGLSLAGNTRIQQIFSRTEFNGVSVIDTISFRRDQFYPAFTSPIDVILQINLGYSATTVETASAVFADNIGSGYTTVFNGFVSLTSPGTGSPNPFDLIFDVADQFTYDPALGDLLVDFRITFAESPFGFVPVTLDATGFGQQSVVNTVRGTLNATSGLLGSFGPGSPPLGLVTQFDLIPAQTDDWYSVDVTETPRPLQFRTATPGDGPGEFANTLNPKIELYDPDGNLVASGVVGPDGRNETLSFTPHSPGTYRVRVIGEDGTRGEYVLARNTRPLGGGSSAALSGQSQGSVNSSIHGGMPFERDMAFAPSPSDGVALHLGDVLAGGVAFDLLAGGTGLDEEEAHDVVQSEWTSPDEEPTRLVSAGGPIGGDWQGAAIFDDGDEDLSLAAGGVDLG